MLLRTPPEQTIFYTHKVRILQSVIVPIFDDTPVLGFELMPRTPIRELEKK